MTKSDEQLRAIRDSVAGIGRLSDSLVRVGPFSLGVDGILSWVPGVGELYSTLAGGFIIVQGVRAGVPFHILGAAATILIFRTSVSAIPIAGSAFADLFTAHKWAAAMVVRAIDAKLRKAGSLAVQPAYEGWRPGTASRGSGGPVGAVRPNVPSRA